MLVCYASKTGKVKKFVSKLNGEINCVNINDVDILQVPYIILTYTTGFGEVPREIEEFLRKNSEHLVGVASSGNKAWGKNVYAKSGDWISEKYNVPLLMKFENDGFESDVKLFEERVHELYGKLDREK